MGVLPAKLPTRSLLLWMESRPLLPASIGLRCMFDSDGLPRFALPNMPCQTVLQVPRGSRRPCFGPVSGRPDCGLVIFVARLALTIGAWMSRGLSRRFGVRI